MRNPSFTEEGSKRSDLRGPLGTLNPKELETFPGAARRAAQAMFDFRPHVADCRNGRARRSVTAPCHHGAKDGCARHASRA